MKQFEFEVPVVIYSTRTVYVTADNADEALEALKNGDGDSYDGHLPEDVEHDFDNASLVAEEEVES